VQALAKALVCGNCRRDLIPDRSPPASYANRAISISAPESGSPGIVISRNGPEHQHLTKPSEAPPQTDEACCGAGSDRRFVTSSGTDQSQEDRSQTGFRTALFFTRTYNRLLRPGIAAVLPTHAAPPTSLTRDFAHLEPHITAAVAELALTT
jgi:hypothetical protein